MYVLEYGECQWLMTRIVGGKEYEWQIHIPVACFAILQHNTYCRSTRVVVRDDARLLMPQVCVACAVPAMGVFAAIAGKIWDPVAKQGYILADFLSGVGHTFKVVQQ